MFNVHYMLIGLLSLNHPESKIIEARILYSLKVLFTFFASAISISWSAKLTVVPKYNEMKYHEVLAVSEYVIELMVMSKV